MRSVLEGISSASGAQPEALVVRITRPWAGPGRRRGSAAAGWPWYSFGAAPAAST